jgi:hypothetical protein
LNLIQILLNSSKGEEPEILKKYENLIDADLVEIMLLMAAKLTEEGDEDNAIFLRRNAYTISAFIGQALSVETDDEFIQMILQAVHSSNGDL